VELTELLNAGGIAGLVSNALSAIWVILFAHLRPQSATSNRSGEQHIAMLIAHLVVGISLGFIFWLSWGFTAIVGITWWQRGIVFAFATWTLCLVPLASTQLHTVRVPRNVTVTVATQWLLTFVLAGLACAWSWGHRS
jgi:hypothetical protein